MEEAGKTLKYTDVEVTRMWNVKTSTTPFIVGALGTIKQGLDQHLQSIPGNTSMKLVQNSPCAHSPQSV
ncbi:unnamed protein product [Acanthoscelides obtectus]|uniref:Uncharacterized protein n=1 Tax=Acanthoscelides obtectus TaxID=200917 RepID=A0A9P0NUK5_ACAOB|nr:unnamed protein product [Acanthoscelides obtectus]CAK1678683.1 hypothetical protein AOBTE_LOCUS31996 [Acanthoscelides obtectus]